MHPSRNSTFLNKCIQLRIQLKNIFNHQKNAEYQIISQTDNRWTHIQNTHMCKYLYNLHLFVLWSLNTFNIRYLSILKNCESHFYQSNTFTKYLLLKHNFCLVHTSLLPSLLINFTSWSEVGTYTYVCSCYFPSIIPTRHRWLTEVTVVVQGHSRWLIINTGGNIISANISM